MKQLLESMERRLEAMESMSIFDRQKAVFALMGDMDKLYNPILDEGTLYSRRFDERRAYSNLMHNARNSNNTLHYRVARRKEFDANVGGTAPIQISDATLHEYWISVRNPTISAIQVLKDALDKNEAEAVKEAKSKQQANDKSVAGELSHEEHRRACMFNLPAKVFGTHPKSKRDDQ